jgi:hypothetical protein
MSSQQMRKLINILEEGALTVEAASPPSGTKPALGKLAKMCTKPYGYDDALEHMGSQAVNAATFANMSVGDPFEFYAGSSTNISQKFKGKYQGLAKGHIQIVLPSGKTTRLRVHGDMIESPFADGSPLFASEEMAAVYGALESAGSDAEDLSDDPDLKKACMKIAKQLNIPIKLAVLIKQYMEDEQADAAHALSVVNKY